MLCNNVRRNLQLPTNYVFQDGIVNLFPELFPEPTLGLLAIYDYSTKTRSVLEAGIVFYSSTDVLMHHNFLWKS